jgi:CRP-like cAMP-binding protein
LTPEEQEIRRVVFPDLPSRKVLQILSIGAWTTVEIGERMLERGKSVEAISLIVRGKVRITRDDRVFGELVTGHIVGSALLLSGVTADVDAVVLEPVRCMRWEVEPLDRYLAANLEARMALQKYLARDLAGKVLAAAKHL